MTASFPVLKPLSQNLVRMLFRTPMLQWGVRLIDMLPEHRAGLVRVLTYHRVDHVDARGDLDPSLISATPDQFARQVGWFARDFDLISINDLVAAVEGHGPALPKRALLLTFDDAYRDFAIHAWPVLRDRAAPATLFVPSAFPDETVRAFWWDRLYCAIVVSQHADRIVTPFGAYDLMDDIAKARVFRELKQRLKSLPEHELQSAVDELCDQCRAPHPAAAVMNWDQLKRLHHEGVALVPHTHTHPLLDRIPREAARGEIRRSREELQRRIGHVQPVFAYPSGHFDAQIASIVRQEGFKLAFSTIRGMNDLRSFDPLTMRRANVGRSTPDALIRLQLTAVARWMNRPVPKHFAKPIAEVSTSGQETVMASETGL